MLERSRSPVAQAAKPWKLKGFRSKQTQCKRREAKAKEKGQKRGKKRESPPHYLLSP
ncbi:hypothetical protein SLEP1_g28115 [Rubroshorea leprosula]|uniref:Uncharacterized protein n=1 Tax=Rubroshorea leprosula TaxID=152421 RepID=A0AAV5JZ35_9ROSI|nr:hypothetical protein SLEP1_g28115 [Rubroshorea leprosula]